MLGKLIKHEWRSTYRMGCLMLAAVALITLLGWLAFQTPMWKSLRGNAFSFGWQDIFGFMTLMMYALLLVGINYGILIYLGVHFYKTMYTDEGYLTHTLPVTENQLLFSKILVSGLWMLFEMLAIIASYSVLGLTLFSILLPDGFALSGMWREVTAYTGELLSDLGFDALGWLVKAVLMSLLSSFTSVTILFGAISLGQLFSRHRLLMAILCYIGIIIVEGLAGIGVRSFAFSVGVYLDAFVDFSFFANLLLAVVLYIVSHYVNSRKLNLL